MEVGPNGIPQGLKPIDSVGFIGTTEVVPFQSEQISSPNWNFEFELEFRARIGTLAQKLRGFFCEIGDDEVGAGTPNPHQGLERGAVPVQPALLESGLKHRIFA